MPRKGHTKSRRGCNECKRRHLKCDETRPICQRCRLSNRSCVFVTNRIAASADSPTNDASPASQVAHPRTRRNNVTRCSSIESNAWTFENSPGALTTDSLLHIELFYNFEHQVCRTFTRTEEHTEIYRQVMLRRVFKLPYLMQAALGLSALHRSLENTNRAPVFKHASAVLQSQALQSFDSSNIINSITDDNVLDLLLFQHLVALQVFCDNFTNIENDFSDFIERLVGCIQLLRGLDSVTTSWQDSLANSELGLVIQTAHAHQRSPHESRLECDPLLNMLAEADLSAQSIEICRSSATMLQAYFDAENDLVDELADNTNMLFSWLITVSREYADLLVQRRPEALVILAYYAVLLHRRRRNWAVGNAGEKLLRHIRKYLGSTWDKHLEWPTMEILAENL